MTEKKIDRTSKLLAELTASGPISMRDTAAMAKLFREPALISREICARLQKLEKEHPTKEGEPPRPEDEETAALIAEERNGVLLLIMLLCGKLEGKTEKGWEGQQIADFLAAAIPGNLYEESPDFKAGTMEAAIENFLLIYNGVYGKFAAFEQLMAEFNEPVKEEDFEGMVMVFARLASGASKSVRLPKVFDHMDFSGEPVKDES